MSRGYTLFEMLAVLTILAMVWALILPPLDRFHKSIVLYSAAQTLAGDLKASQESAQSFHGKEKIVFTQNSPGGWQYQRIQIFSDNSEKSFPEKLLPEKINFSSNFTANTVSFNNLGNPNKAGQITLEFSGGRKRDIVISPIGRIRVASAS